MIRYFCLIIALTFYSTFALAAETLPVMGVITPPKTDFTELRPINVVTVRRVIDPLRIELTSGEMIQLSGIDIPEMNGQDPGDVAVAVSVFLKDLLENRQVRLYQTKDADTGRVNRMGYQLAQLEKKDGDVWVQGILLANGLARVWPSARNPEMAKQMMAIEAEAREKKRGLWANPKYTLLTPETAGQALHSMAVIEGTIRAVGASNNKTYLNFGPDWHTDFTIGITSDIRRKLMTANINLQDLANRKVRVHGWVEDYNGPYIELVDPVWMEIFSGNTQTIFKQEP